MEARIARIEAHVENLDVNLGELRLGQTRLDAKVDHGFERLDAKIDHASERLDAKIDHAFERLDARIDGGLERLDARIERLDATVDRRFLLLGGMIVSLGVGIAGLMAKGFHWV